MHSPYDNYYNQDPLYDEEPPEAEPHELESVAWAFVVAITMASIVALVTIGYAAWLVYKIFSLFPL